MRRRPAGNQHTDDPHRGRNVIEQAIRQRRKDLGGIEVGRLLPNARQRMVGPFVFLDHIGPVELAAGLSPSVDVRPHPHIGLATLTWLFAGEIMHRDSLGSEQPIRPGEVNWMIAGRGITHSERFERARAEGGPLHGLQAWVALPEADEECDPAFVHVGRDAVPTFEQPDQRGSLIAGRAYGIDAPVDVRSPLCYLHWQLDAGARWQLPDEYSERALYVVEGEVDIDGQAWPAGHLLICAPGTAIEVGARQPARLMLLAGEPLGPRHIEWNFVSSSPARIEQARRDWREGRFRLPYNDDRDFIPLPERRLPPEPMS